MKCTSKRMIGILAVLAAALMTGCGDDDIAFPYDPNYEVSGFRVLSEDDFVTAEPFAADLCVVNGDVNVNDAVVDMSEATAAGLFDLNRHEVLYAKNVHERLAPASLTKLMTAVVALKYGNPDDIITVTAGAKVTESGAVVCGLQEGDQLTLNQALHVLLIHSANDAALAIAEHVAGSVEQFCALMNEEALAIGATNSHFVNPNGLTADDHYVTAYDMYLIFNEALKYDMINEIISMTSYDTVYTGADGSQKTFSYQNTNQYISGAAKAPDNVTVIGGKTGTTNAAGNCLILLVRDTSGNPYISVILRSSQRDYMYAEMTDLLDEIG